MRKTGEAETEQGPAGISRRRAIFAGAAAIALCSIAYSTLVITDIEGSLGPLFTALGLALVAFLVLAGVLRQEESSDGAIQIALRLLPRFSDYAARSRGAFLLLTGLLLLTAAAAYWIGPARVREIAVVCGQAASIRLDDGEERRCNTTFAGSIWRRPYQRKALPKLTCVTDGGDAWTRPLDPEGKGACGNRPQSARYVRNGIRRPPLDEATATGARTARSLDALSRSLRRELPERGFNDVLLVATWNMRGFGQRFGFGDRIAESYLYIAEILSFFDLVALQEVQGIRDLERILDLLGPDYDAAVSAVAPGPAGNAERLVFVFDKRKIARRPFASAVIVTGERLRSLNLSSAQERRGSRINTGQPSRPPFMAEFESAGRRFRVLTAHIYFGNPSDTSRRIAEIDDIFSYVAAADLRESEASPLIFGGNIQARSAAGPEVALLDCLGYALDPDLRSAGSNVSQDKPYDQIAILQGRNTSLHYARTGVFNYYRSVFRDQDFVEYKPELMHSPLARRSSSSGSFNARRAFQMWRTYQMSDHLPKWAELRLGQARGPAETALPSSPGTCSPQRPAEVSAPAPVSS